MKIKREVKIGFFAVLMLGALYWGINFLRGQDLFNLSNTYYAAYDQVSGVQKSSAIMVKGFKVGVISDIMYDPAKSDKIILELNIQSKYKIPENSQARIYSDGLLGGKAMEIVLGNSEKCLVSGDTLHSYSDKGFLEMAGSELEYFKQKASSLVDNMNKTLVTVNSMLENNAEGLSRTIDNIAQMSGALNHLIDSEKGHLRSIIEDVNALSGVLKDNAGRIDGIISNVEAFTDSLAVTDIKSVADNINTLLGELHGTLDKLNNGEGSLGKLLTDDGLYDSLTEASNNLALLLEDLKANPKRYVNFSVFGRKDKK